MSHIRGGICLSPRPTYKVSYVRKAYDLVGPDLIFLPRDSGKNFSPGEVRTQSRILFTLVVDISHSLARYGIVIHVPIGRGQNPRSPWKAYYIAHGPTCVHTLRILVRTLSPQHSREIQLRVGGGKEKRIESLGSSKRDQA